MKSVKNYLRDINEMKKTRIQLGFDGETLKQGFRRRREKFKTKNPRNAL